MPVITTFGGAAARSFGRGIEQVPAALPANTVLFYHITNSTTQGSTPSASWSLFNTGQKYIIGTATQAEIDTSSLSAAGAATMTGTTGISGAHSGGTTFTTPPYGGATDIYSNYAGTAGNHSHALSTVDLSSALANTIAITTVTTTQTQLSIPAGCVVFRKVAPTSLNFTALTFSGTGYFYGRSAAANTTWTDKTVVGGAIGTSVGSGGAHSHVQSSNYYNWGGTFSSNLNVTAGSHSDHSIAFNVEIRMKSLYLKAWVSTVDEPVEYGMIVMYKGDLAKLPSGWRICDGSLGTPDMRDNAVVWASTGTHGSPFYTVGSAVVPSTQTGMTGTSSWNHTHVGASSTIRGSNGFHSSFNASHAHSFSVTALSGSSYSPPYHKLAFIQYKGI